MIRTDRERAERPERESARSNIGSAFKGSGRWFAAVLILLLAAGPVLGAPPQGQLSRLSRGINITGWFRYPASTDPVVLSRWLSDTAIVDLRQAGFSFVRLPFDPAILAAAPVRTVFLEQIRRLQRHGLAVIVSPHPVTWRIETNAADRARFIAFWRTFAPALQTLPPALTFPEVLNEPVFHDEPASWWRLQHDLLVGIRMALPRHTVVLTGQDWGGITGLLTLPPEMDKNVMYSFHFYEPAELTSLAAWRPELDRNALAHLPFPGGLPSECERTAGGTDPRSAGVIRFYCAMNQDAGPVRARIQSAADWGRRHGVALLAGEFGATSALNGRSRLAWLRLIRETCAEHSIPWALWGYDDVMGFDVKRPPIFKPVLDQSVKVALGLPGP